MPLNSLAMMCFSVCFPLESLMFRLMSVPGGALTAILMDSSFALEGVISLFIENGIFLTWP